MAGTGTPTVLLVEADAGDRERYGAWLEEAGLTVINCPGPHLPGFSCTGVCGGPCPLIDVADIAVLDTRNLPGIDRRGLPGWRLLRFYLAQGKPVVVIADRYRKERAFRPEQVFVLKPQPGEQSLLLAVRSMLREARQW
ncbi:MAG TPA: response regulator [Candidatus Limnocylindrales bacterium]|nr:response regulator [Candidatus Limnocylindrales bacterium]